VTTRHRRLTASLVRRLAGVRLVGFDFDGVFTDNLVWVFEDGREAVSCTRADGLGLRKLEALGVGAVIISTEVNPVVSARARKLAVRCVQGCDDKVSVLKEFCCDAGITLGAAAFVGNDINDAACLGAVGVPIVVADAHPDLLPLAVYRTAARGGRGAVREVCDMIDYAHRRVPSRQSSRSKTR
jgi:3-deoxy-D-manno-octulosonate 8-phosphate phosphatase (KDO 8-P phosphatase)